MKVDERRHRDAKVMRLYLAAATYREIAHLLGLKSPGSVDYIARRELCRAVTGVICWASGH
jgi:hypothetical protein